MVLEEVKEGLEKKLGEEFKKSLMFEIEKMQIGVDDIRRMKEFCYMTSEGIKFIFLSSFYWNSSSQNAMLKVLEETPTNTFIYLFGPAEKYFLPTVLSRVQKVHKKNSNRYLKEAKEILSLQPNERLENKIVKKVLGLKVVDVNYEKNTDNEKKDRESQIMFLFALVDVILQNRNISQGTPLPKGVDTSKASDGGFLEKINIITQVADIEGGNPTLFIEWLLLSANTIG